MLIVRGGLMSKYRAYPAYKASGVEWLGDVPEHWEVKRLKFLAQISNGQDQKQVIDDNGCYSIYGSGGIFGKSNEYLYNQPSVLLGRKGTIDKPLFVTEPFWTVDTMYYTKIYPITFPKFFFYQCLTIQFAMYQYGSALPSMTQESLNGVLFSTPEYIEQQQIADFLDDKTAHIDKLIEQKQQMIKLLNEKRIALITQAVTKGLDLTVPMKDSCVEWLGNVPEHWEVKRLRFVINSNPVKSELVNFDINNLVSFVPMENVGEYGGIVLANEKPLSDVYTGYTYFAENDVILAKITPCFENGKGAIAKGLTNGIAFGTTELHVMRPLTGYSENFLFYLSISYSFREIGASEMYGAGGQKRVPEDFIKNFCIGFPEYIEQQQIANYLDTETQKIDDMIKTVKLAITTLQEYRTALITAAVTGKIDVRDFKIPTHQQEGYSIFLVPTRCVGIQ